MKALRWHGPRNVQLDEVPEPAPGPGEVLLHVLACGICGSDLHEYLHGPLFIPSEPHPLTGVVPPVTLGHEFCGRVVSVGAQAGEVREGVRVAVNPCLLCGECRWCRRGQPNYCAKLGCLGLSRDGAFAPLVAVPAYGCHPLPPEVDDPAGAVVEPLSVVLHAIRRARLTGGEPVAIIGAGTIGLLLVQALRAKHAGLIAVVEPREDRRRLARELRADAVIDPRADDPAGGIARLTAGDRAAVAFECVGSAAAVDSAIRITGKGGRVVLVGLLPAPVQLDALRLVAHEKTLTGSVGYVDEFPEAIALLRDGRVRVDRLVTARVPLRDALRNGLEAMLAPESSHVKILVTPTD